MDSLLSRNRFAALSADLATPDRLARQKAVYSIDIGKDKIKMTLAPLDPAPANWTTTSTAFYGRCHNCGYRAHSHKQCPLRRCSRCGRFGHARALCTDNIDTPSVT